ncbi:hypothetical protein QQF64_018463 [Cirrhinus molitorella]|uniref:HAT C-terminal dimerisation domain-containing protein n=1 Tax=Cirrhinus molitorella TaxID=172907 RepID=A0ABR3LCP9_9TELE
MVDEMHPLSTVEAPTFRNIIRKISVTGKQTGSVLPDRKTFTDFLDNAYMEKEEDLKKTFADLEYVSTTADLWTAHNKSFLGITVHWIDPASLHRQKAAIACRRFRGRHTYDAIAAEMEQIHSLFALCGKIWHWIYRLYGIGYTSRLSRHGLTPSLLAAVTLPKFKLRWLRDETRKDTIKMTLAAQRRALTIELPQKEPLQSPESKDHENDFPEEDNQHDKQATMDMEICEYLKSADMGNLHNFPRILKIYLKANTATPSSAPAERLFSIGSLILTPKRNRLTDQHFERLLLLRYNRYFENKT